MADKKPMPERGMGHTFHHGLRTAKIAMSLLDVDGIAIDVHRDVLFAAGLFHDVGKGQDPHNETGAAMARELLEGVCSEANIDAITQIILEHNQRHRAAECTTASRVQQDADILDHFGAQKIWMSFVYNAICDESPDDALEYYHGQEHQSWIAWCRPALNFKVSREYFDRRIEFEQAFYKRFTHEMQGRL